MSYGVILEENMTANQMKYLLALLNQPEGKQNQSNVAKIYGVNKSTVSRAVAEAVSQGILADASVPYQLTGYGKQYRKEFEYRLDRISDWLRSQGVETEKAREDSFCILGTCSEETIALLKRKGEIIRIHNNVEKLEKDVIISGAEIRKYIEEGEYPVPFVFFRSRLPKGLMGGRDLQGHEISMANQAFYHPAVLYILKAESYLCLRIRNITKKSQVNHREVEGKLKAMKYNSAGKEKAVMLNDEKVYIPIEDMQFFYIPEEHILQGYINVTMSSTVGELSMPESQARLVVYI